VKGACAACGRVPVELAAKPAAWHWCKLHEEWHRKPCAKQAKEKCCRERTAMLVPPGKAALVAGKFCPECGVFCGEACPLEAGKCRRCGRPPVDAHGVERSWFWCETHALWHDAPCPAEATDDCCRERKALLLAKA
jgi:hypothetical protein